ncbi:hypothetical protein [Rhodococcus sp. NPDC058521]|uniref:hypothetical protein n=1 Tax=Rhodococcus sp. NPDC058521 TaxID=3346536 RepID=UPI0036632B36
MNDNTPEHIRAELKWIERHDERERPIPGAGEPADPPDPSTDPSPAPRRSLPHGGLMTMEDALASLRRGAGARALRPARKHDPRTRNRSK